MDGLAKLGKDWLLLCSIFAWDTSSEPLWHERFCFSLRLQLSLQDLGFMREGCSDGCLAGSRMPVTLQRSSDTDGT